MTARRLFLLLLLLLVPVLVFNHSASLGQPAKAKKTKNADKLKKWDPWNDPASWGEAAVYEFKRKDQNGDGYLSRDEMEGKLRDTLDFWDTNKDGLIDLAEYRYFFRWRMEEKVAKESEKAVRAGLMPRIIEAEEERRPVVFRAGKLPKDLPPWFQELDLNKDGQVSLFEWTKAGKSYEEFQEFDRNEDGLLTAEEVIHHVAQVKALALAKGEQLSGPLYSPGPSKSFGPDTFKKPKKDKKPKG